MMAWSCLYNTSRESEICVTETTTIRNNYRETRHVGGGAEGLLGRNINGLRDTALTHLLIAPVAKTGKELLVQGAEGYPAHYSRF